MSIFTHSYLQPKPFHYCAVFVLIAMKQSSLQKVWKNLLQNFCIGLIGPGGQYFIHITIVMYRGVPLNLSNLIAFSYAAFCLC